MTVFPCKTDMWITDEQVIVSQGYRANDRILYKKEITMRKNKNTENQKESIDLNELKEKSRIKSLRQVAGRNSNDKKEMIMESREDKIKRIDTSLKDIQTGSENNSIGKNKVLKRKKIIGSIKGKKFNRQGYILTPDIPKYLNKKEMHLNEIPKLELYSNGTLPIPKNIDFLQLVKNHDVQERHRYLNVYKLNKKETKMKKEIKNWDVKLYPLSTPALEEAYDRKILSEQNYKRILNGGFIAVERFSDTSSHMRNCYNAIKLDANDKKIVIVNRDEESFNCLVSIKKRKFEKERLIFDKELTLSKVIADADGVELLEEEFSKNSPLAKVFG